MSLPACGSSSKSSTTQGTAASAPTSSTPSGGGTSTTRSRGGVTSKPAPKAFGSSKPALTAAEVQRLSQFAACVRKNGVNVPPPRASSSGATLDFKGIDTTAPSVRRAEARCAIKLGAGIRAGSVHLKGIHVGGVKVGGVKVGGVKVGPVHLPGVSPQK